MVVIAEGRLGQVADWPRKDCQEDHEFKVTSLYLLLDVGIHSFLPETVEYEGHDYNGHTDISYGDRRVHPIVYF